MNIVMASDNNGVDMMLVAMYSVIKSNLKNKLHFFIIHTEISNENQVRIRRLKEKFPLVETSIISVDKNLFENVELTNRNVSMPAYYRYLAPDILSSEHRALYLDIDTMCVGDLTEIYSTDLQNFYLGAVEDYFVSVAEDYPGLKDGIGLGKDGRYFNSGVLLMNLDRIRTDNIMKTFWSNIKNKSKIIPKKFNTFADQTVMNITFKGKIKTLNPRYNAMTTALAYVKPKKVAIVHFTGADKPFTYRSDSSSRYNDAYYDYYNECMAIAGGNGNLMIKNTIKRLGKETSESIAKRVEIEQLARDKSSHVEELANELGDLNSKYEVLSAELNEVNDRLRAITSSFSWKITKPLRVLSRIKKVLRRG